MILVDASNCVIRNMFSPRNQSCMGLRARHDFKGAIGAFFEIIQLAERDNDHNIIACFDSAPYLKAADVSGFKADRKESSDEEKAERNANLDLFDRLCELAGVITWRESGYEADDLIAMCVEDSSSAVIAANDSDLHQLFAVSKGIIFKTPGTYITYKDFLATSPVSAGDLPLFLSITGTHNGLKGIRGYGVVKTTALFESNATVNAFYNAHRDDIDRQMRAIYLPYDNTYLPIPKKPTTHDLPALEELVFNSGAVADVKLLDFLR